MYTEWVLQRLAQKQEINNAGSVKLYSDNLHAADIAVLYAMAALQDSGLTTVYDHDVCKHVGMTAAVAFYTMRNLSGRGFIHTDGIRFWFSDDAVKWWEREKTNPESRPRPAGSTVGFYYE